jgi:hypothetical protein
VYKALKIRHLNNLKETILHETRLQIPAKISVNETPPGRPQKYKKHRTSQTFMLLVRREVDASPPPAVSLITAAG